MKRLLIILVPLLAISLLLGSAAVLAGKGERTRPKADIPTPAPSTPDETRAVLKDSAVLEETIPGATREAAAGEQISRWVMSNGGSWGSSSMWQVGATLGQSSVGSGGSVAYQMNSGFWAAPVSEDPGCCDNAGDANHDGSVDISDLTYFVDFMFGGGPPPVCLDEFDNDANCSNDISDLTFYVEYMFGGGPSPECGCAEA